ncbi:MAG: cobalt-precorrin-6A reductase [Alphaproteobacteria bacterium]
MNAQPGPTKILILGGTAEAAGLARALAGVAGVATITSLAGRTQAPAVLPGEVRVGGFGGPVALVDYLGRAGIGLVVDATHPFAARISRNAAEACDAAGLPRLLLARPPWTARAGDNWIPAADAATAAATLPDLGRRVFLAIGRQELAAFAGQSQPWFLVRLVEQPEAPPPLADYHLVLGRGPFAVAREIELLREHRIEVVVSKNSGGAGAAAKIAAARELELRVVMIERPPAPASETAESVEAARTWIGSRLS